MRQDECVHSTEIAYLSVGTLVRHHVSACEWGGILAGTLVYRHGPRTGGSRTVGRLCRPDLRWRFFTAVSQSDVRTRHVC